MIHKIKCRRAATENGFALVPVVFMLALLGVFAFISSRETATNAAMSENEMQNDSDVTLVAAAMAHGKWLAQSNSCELPPNREGIRFAGGTYDLEFSGSPAVFKITSTTTSKEGEQLVEVLEDQVIYDYANSRVLDVVAVADAALNMKTSKMFENNGDAQDMHLNSKSTELEYPVLRFELSSIPASAKVVNGIFSVAVKDNEGNQDTVRLHRLTTEWSESEVSSAVPWSQNGGDYDATPAAQFEITQSGTKAVDITQLASEWINGQYENFGFILRLEATAAKKHMKLHSREAGDSAHHPRLSVSYVCPCGQSCDAGVVVEDFMVATASEATLMGQSFQATDLMHVSRAKSEIDFELEGDLHRFRENITAAHKLANDRYLLSFNHSFTPAGTTFEPQDIVEYDASTQVFRMYIDGSSIGIAENISSVAVTLDGRVVISLDKEAEVFGVTYQDSDLFVIDSVASSTTLFFEGSKHGIDKEISAAHILEDGNIVLSFKNDTSVDAVTAYAGDLIFFDVTTESARLYFSGSAFEDAELIRAVHIGEGIGDINRMEAHFPFDEQSGSVARDVIGSREADIDDTSQWKPGGWNGALGFDGAGDYLKFGSDSGLQFARSFTTMMWVLSDSGDVGEQIVLSKSDGTNDQSFRMGFDSGHFNWSLSSSAETIRLGPFAGLADGAWHHVAMVFDVEAATASTYIDGAIEGVLNTSFVLEANTNNFVIGAGWRGVLDELIVYNYPLTEKEIVTEASKSLARPDTLPSASMEAASESNSEEASASVEAANCKGGVADYFDSYSYARSNGSVAWNDSWIEENDDNNASSGSVKISGFTSDKVLQFNDPGGALVRRIPLYDATKMTLSFDVESVNLGSSETLRVRMSPNGFNGDWQDIDELDSDTSIGRKQYDITSFAGTDPHVAFESSRSGLWWWKTINIDNVLIRCTQ